MCIGLVHHFILGSWVSSQNHCYESRRVLCRVFLFTYDAMVRGSPQRFEHGEFFFMFGFNGLTHQCLHSERLLEHVPNVLSIDGVVDLFYLVIVIILTNVLHCGTYSKPQTSLHEGEDLSELSFDDRVLFCTCRGMALAMVKWFSLNYTIRISPTSVQPRILGPFLHDGVISFEQLFWGWLSFFAVSIYRYKEAAEASGHTGTPGCTSGHFKAQLRAVLQLMHPNLQVFDRMTDAPSSGLPTASTLDYPWLFAPGKIYDVERNDITEHIQVGRCA